MPGIANRTVPRLRAQPGSLLSLLPVRNVKDQPVGGSRREQTHTHTHTIKCTHTHQCARGDKYTHHYAYTHIDVHKVTQTKSMHAQTHRNTATQTSTPTLRHKHTQAWLTMVSHHEGSSQAKP